MAATSPIGYCSDCPVNILGLDPLQNLRKNKRQIESWYSAPVASSGADGPIDRFKLSAFSVSGLRGGPGRRGLAARCA